LIPATSVSPFIGDLELPKENTHILLINRVADTIPCEAARKLMRTEYLSLCFGSIVADTFFYSPNREIVEISERLHGKEGEKTNELTFHLLELAKGYKSDSLLSMTLGHISHCVFDMIFHPVIYYLVGNYYDEDPLKRRAAVYRHRLMETRLDYELNNRFHLHSILRGDETRLHDFLELFAARFNVGKEELVKAYRRQVMGNRCFKSPLTYIFIRILHRLGAKGCGHILPLFYRHLGTDDLQFRQTVSIRDIIEGHPRRENLNEMLESARKEAINRITAAIVYYDGNVDQAAAMEIIRGESLDTGREGCPVGMIRYTE
jgi:hypothetical protein